jgi:2-polyprenyl-6-methoxyphenol hydroxylase-like FAD-dependent oxidoreductase
MLPTSTKVLIVGAGPTGLCTAISLVKHGVSIDDITIVDAILEGENSSRATVVHSATLEVCNSAWHLGWWN